jgi:hypothetical protein
MLLAARVAITAASLLILTALCSAEDAPNKQPCIIGDANMLADGTIVLNLRRTCDGTNVSGTEKYAPGQAGYREMLDHLGG